MKTASARIGFMQGRLVDLVDGKIQAFPWDHWKDEFKLANNQGLALMEWTLDHERLEENPLMSASGQGEINVLCKKNKLTVPSLTGDFLMQKPFYKVSVQDAGHLFDSFLKVIDACSKLGIEQIIFPLVDNGRIENKEQQKNLLAYLNKIVALLNQAKLTIAFEIDFKPEDVRSFIEELPANTFAINYDIGNSAGLGYDYAQELKAYGKRISNVHVKDRKFYGTTVPLGQGNADIQGVIQGLEDLGYQGNYILQTARSTSGRHVEDICRHRDMVQKFLEK